MDTRELENKIKTLGVPMSSFSLHGEMVVGHVLEKHGDKWQVFLRDDRGGHRDQKYFESEEEACEYLYQRALWEAEHIPLQTREEIKKRYGTIE